MRLEIASWLETAVHAWPGTSIILKPLSVPTPSQWEPSGLIPSLGRNKIASVVVFIGPSQSGGLALIIGNASREVADFL